MSTPASVVSRESGFADFIALTKPRITLMVMLTCGVGYAMASPAGVPALGLLAAVLFTGLVSSGASVFNMVLEKRTDALMRRTRNRPIPAGRVGATEAVVFGALLTLAGLLGLALLAQPLSAAVALVTWASYAFVYTPLKTRTSLSTLVGAVPGALPTVIGWTAASGRIDPGALVLFAILFLWQIPHFLAIAWLNRDDYALGGMPMLPVIDRAGLLTARQAVAHSLALLLVSLAPALGRMAGPLYAAGALLLGIGLVAVTVRMAVRRDLATARHLFHATLAYLPALYTLLLLDRR